MKLDAMSRDKRFMSMAACGWGYKALELESLMYYGIVINQF